jgi:cytoskeletal protein CcmA (bactofilin family)
MALFGGKEGRDGKDGREREAAPSPAVVPSSDRTEASSLASVRPERNTRSAPPIQETNMASVGKSIIIKGDLSGDEDVLVEGKVEGKVDLPQNQLTVGANGICEATVHAKTVIVVGRIAGDVSAVERVEVQSTGVVEGDVKSPRLIVEEGAVLNGSISMTKKEGAETSPRTTPQPKSQPGPKPAPGAGLGATP